ncbi:MAG: hypothetical protein JXA73_26315 [Acidobacteria bacterium]|nr:hypothetical protein [Acidobacteriota bacterium]
MRIESCRIFKGTIQIFGFLFFYAGTVHAQAWTRVEVSDPQRDQPYAEFTLQGKFLQAPPAMSESSPRIILHCQPGRYSSGHLHGKLLAAVLNVGKMVDGAMVRNEIRDELFSSKPDLDGYYVEFNLDDGELKADHWDNILDYQAVGFGPEQLNDILWGQTTPRKEDGNPPVKKFVISVQQNIAGKIVMQFDMPDPAVVSEFCGCTYFKKKD